MLIFSLDHDEARGFRGRRYLRAGQSPGHARAKARGRIAASMLDIGQQTPILVRADGARFVLVEGLHRLEAETSSASAWKSASIKRPFSSSGG